MKAMELIKFIIVFFGVSGLCVINASQHSYCLESAYCNLIKGDIAKESDKFKKDSTKYYSEAKINIEKDNQFKSKNDNSINKDCNETLFLCIDEVTKMAIDGLGYPNDSAQHCMYTTYSRDIFRCENIKKWPVDVRKALGMQEQICQLSCRFDKSNYTLSHGKTLYSESEELNMDDILPVDVVQDRMYKDSKSRRPLSPWMSGFDETSVGPDWGLVNVCKNKNWVMQVNKNSDSEPAPMYTTHIDCIYFLANPGVHPECQFDHLRSIPKISEELIGRSYHEDCRRHVSGTSKHSFVIGVRIERMPYIIGNYTTALKAIHFLCADGVNGVWKYINNITPNFTSPDVDIERICPNGTAICALQTKYIEDKKGSGFNGKRRYVVLNVRFACCEGISNDNNHENFVYIKVDPIPTPKPPTPTDGIFRLQIIPIYVFWDEDSVYNGIISRFNEYYSVSFIPYQDKWSTSQCAAGAFLNGFYIKDSKACYYQGIRIMEINIICGKADGHGTEKIDLDIYNTTLKNGHTLQDHLSEYNSTCVNGFYNNMELTYYVHKKSTYMVRAWGFGMNCSDSTSIGPHKHIINPLKDRGIQVTEYNEVKAISQCENGMAICGIQKKIIHEGRGTFEGLFIKIICCYL